MNEYDVTVIGRGAPGEHHRISIEAIKSID